MLASLQALSSFFSAATTPAPSAGASQAPPPQTHLSQTHSTHHSHPHPHPQGCHCHHHHPSSHASAACLNRWHTDDQPSPLHYSPFTEHFLQSSRRRDLYAPYPSPIHPHIVNDSHHGSQPPSKTRCTRCRRLKSEVEVLREQVWTLTMQVRTFQHQHQPQVEAQPQHLIGGGPEPVVLSEGRTPMKRRRGDDEDEDEVMILWAPKKKAAWIGTTARHVHGRTSFHPWHDDASSMSSSDESSSSSFSTPAASSSRSSSELLPTRAAGRRRRPTRPISPISWEQDVESGSDRPRPGATQGRYRSPTPYVWYSPPSSPSPYTPAALLVAETAHDLPMDGPDDEDFVVAGA